MSTRDVAILVILVLVILVAYWLWFFPAATVLSSSKSISDLNMIMRCR